MLCWKLNCEYFVLILLNSVRFVSGLLISVCSFRGLINSIRLVFLLFNSFSVGIKVLILHIMC